MLVKIQFGRDVVETYENVTEVDDTGGAFKMQWEAEGAPGYVDTAIPWHRIHQVEVQYTEEEERGSRGNEPG